MILGDDTAALVHKDPAPDTELLDLFFKDFRVDEHAAPDTEFCLRIHKTGGNHPDTVFLVPDLDRVAGIGTDTTAGDDNGFICMSDVGNNLALPFIPEKSAYDNSTTH